MRPTGKRASLPATGSEGSGPISITYLALRRSSFMVSLSIGLVSESMLPCAFQAHQRRHAEECVERVIETAAVHAVHRGVREPRDLDQLLVGAGKPRVEGE